MNRFRRCLLTGALIVGAACTREHEPGPTPAASAPTTTTSTLPAPSTLESFERPLPASAAPSSTWAEVLSVGDAEAVVPLAIDRWVVVTDDELIEYAHDDHGWTPFATTLPPGVTGLGTPLVTDGYVVPLASGGLLVADQTGAPVIVDSGEPDADWVYSDGVSLFSTDGRALDRAWNDEVAVRGVDTMRTPTGDRFRVLVEGSSVIVDLFDLDRRVRIDVGGEPDVSFAADLSGAVHLVVRAGARAGYLAVTSNGEVSEIEAVPADAHVSVVPSTTTVALWNRAGVWTRIAPDTVGIVSADLPEETCQWVRDYAVDYGGVPAPAMQLEQGSVPGFPSGYGGAWLSAADGVFRPDLDGDGARDAAFVIWCAAGASGHNAEIHTIDAHGRSLGWFQVGEDAGTRGLWSFTTEGNDLVVEYPTWDTDEAGCCATIRVTDRYRWTNGTLARVGRRTWSAADAAAEILGRFNRDADDALAVADPDAFVALRRLRDEHGALRGCASTASGSGDTGGRTCVITAADEPDVGYQLTLTWIDVDEWQATGLEPIRG